MRRKAWTAFVLLLIAVPGESRAAGGEWAPIAGSEWAATAPDYQPAYFLTRDGSLSVSYDDSSFPILVGSITLDTGSAGYVIVADRQISESVFGNTIWFQAYSDNGSGITAILEGNANDPATWTNATVSASPGYHGLEMWFTGAQVVSAAVPEPPAGLLLALGAAAAGLAGAARRRERNGDEGAERGRCSRAERGRCSNSPDRFGIIAGPVAAGPELSRPSPPEPAAAAGRSRPESERRLRRSTPVPADRLVEPRVACSRRSGTICTSSPDRDGDAGR